MATTWKRFSPEKALLQQRAVTEVYRASFAEPPWLETKTDADRFAERWPETTRRPGFRLVAMSESHGGMVGLAFGYDLPKDDRWRGFLGQAGADPAVWEKSFLLAELAVVPSHRRRGLARILSDALLRNLPHPTALLLTRDVASPALAFYRREGWEPLGRLPRPNGIDFVILKRHLSPGQEGAPGIR